MAALPQVIMRRDSVLHRIDDALEAQESVKRREQQVSPPMIDRMSGTGDCSRKRWADSRGLPLDPGKGFPPKLLRMFRMGNLVEDEVVRLLELAGFDVTDRQLEVGGDRWVGHIDGIIAWDSPPRRALLEIKSCNRDRFALLQEIGYTDWSDRYAAQLQAYMGALDLEEAIVVVYNRNDSDIYAERVLFDADHFGSLKTEALTMIESEHAVMRPPKATSRSCKFCKWCDRQEWCWDQETNGVRFDP